jgi:hypothetical protein
MTKQRKRRKHLVDAGPLVVHLPGARTLSKVLGEAAARISVEPLPTWKGHVVTVLKHLDHAVGTDSAASFDREMEKLAQVIALRAKDGTWRKRK